MKKSKEPKEEPHCEICGCKITHQTYTSGTHRKSSDVSTHHFIAQRFFEKKPWRPRILKTNPWPEVKKEDTGQFCFECHEELLHNPVLLRGDICQFVKLVKLKGEGSKVNTQRRIELLHEVIERGLKTLIAAEKRKK